ncbi:hypothetical protein BO068_005362, partial [Escherichia coli]|nr:hypothetical protein [Escherichia coli]
MSKQPASKSSPKKSAASATVSLEPIPEPSPQDIKKEANPFTDGDLRMRTYAWAGYALRLMLIVGAFFSIFQYLTARQERRVERTMQLVELWEQNDYQDAQQALKRRLVDLNAKYGSLLGANPTPKEIAVYNRRIGLEALTEGGGAQSLPEFQAQFDRVMYFMNRISACATANICAPEMVDEYFRDFGASFWSYFSG